jgi:hypothetical protein
MLTYEDLKPWTEPGSIAPCHTKEVADHMAAVDRAFMTGAGGLTAPMDLVKFTALEQGIPIRALIIKETEIEGSINDALASIQETAPPGVQVGVEIRSV